MENVTTLVVRNGQNGMPNGLPEDGDAAGRKRMNPGSSVNLNGMQNGQTGNHENSSDPVLEELDGIRTREIASKAVSGVLLTLLKWFKLSRRSRRSQSIAVYLLMFRKISLNMNTSLNFFLMLITFPSFSSSLHIKM